MTERIGDKIIVRREKPQQCDLCGKIDALRPYGPNKECICFECGIKNLESTIKRLTEQFEAISEVIIDDK